MTVGDKGNHRHTPLTTTVIYIHLTLTHMTITTEMTITTVQKTDILLQLEAGWNLQTGTMRHQAVWIGLGLPTRGMMPIPQNTIVGRVANETYPGMITHHLTDAGRVTRMRTPGAVTVAGLLATRNGTASQIRDVKSGLETLDLGLRDPFLPRH